jgi:hypothetical protein
MVAEKQLENEQLAKVLTEQNAVCRKLQARIVELTKPDSNGDQSERRKDLEAKLAEKTAQLEKSESNAA